MAPTRKSSHCSRVWRQCSSDIRAGLSGAGALVAGAIATTSSSRVTTSPLLSSFDSQSPTRREPLVADHALTLHLSKQRGHERLRHLEAGAPLIFIELVARCRTVNPVQVRAHGVPFCRSVNSCRGKEAWDILLPPLLPGTTSARSGRALELAPGVGLEPTTLRLTVECSAIELPRTAGSMVGGLRRTRRLAPR